MRLCLMLALLVACDVDDDDEDTGVDIDTETEVDSEVDTEVDTDAVVDCSATLQLDDGLGGCREVAPRLFRVTAGFSHAGKKTGRREWLRARLVAGAGGTPVARKFPREGSGILSSMVEADGLIEIGEDVAKLNKGEPVNYLPFSEVTQ